MNEKIPEAYVEKGSNGREGAGVFKGNEEEGEAEAEFRKDFSGADFLFAIAAFSAKGKPAYYRDIVIPSEPMTAMHADGTRSEFFSIFILMDAPSLAACKRAEDASDIEYDDVEDNEVDTHIIPLSPNGNVHGFREDVGRLRECKFEL